MTLSKTDRQKNLDEALLLLMEDLHGCSVSIMGAFINERFLDSRILRTTWDELKERHLVRETNSRYMYTLSGNGWIQGLKLRGEYCTDELKAITRKLSAALKDKLKGRQCEEMVTVAEVAEKSGLPEAFIRNAIESDLIHELFGTKGATWASDEDRGKFISIPVGFGQKPLDPDPPITAESAR